MKKKEILITGATGRVGGALLRELLAAGLDVRAAYRAPPPQLLPAIHPVRFDLNDHSTHAPALAGIRRLFLLWPPGTDARAAIPPFLDAAVRAGVEQILFLSVLGAERLKVVPHFAIERMLAAAPLRRAILRPGYFYQNLSTTHGPEIRDRDELFVPAGRGRTAMVDVQDVAEVGARLLLDPAPRDAALDLTSEAPTFSELAAALSAELGRPITYRRPGLLRFLRGARERGFAGDLALFMAAEYTYTRLGLAARLSADLTNYLGRSPTTFAQFARRSRGAWIPQSTQ
ncbi:MAG: NmrA family NAD(P)-binding protein [Nannocystis sp.]|nr:NmrA family NAD(P)-binding protein [Nannocystis sp.]